MLTPPSPSISPSLTAQDTIISRKRQRSESMQSEGSSSSPKRSLSEDPSQDTVRTPHSEDMSALTLSEANVDNDIDAYMAEQGDSGATEPLRTPHPPSASTPSPAEKLSLIQSLCREPMKVGEVWHIISRRWYRRWEKACSGEVDKEGAVDEKDIGPIDNAPLVDIGGNLVSSAIEHVDVEFVPERAFLLFVSWYGPPSYPLSRKVIARGMAQEPTLELHPLRLKVHLLSDVSVPARVLSARKIEISSKASVKELLKSIVDSLPDEVATNEEYRVWKISEGAQTGDDLKFSSDKLKAHGATILEPSDLTLEEELVEMDDVFVVEYNIQGWMVEPTEVKSAPNGSPAEPPALFNTGDDFFNKVQRNSSSTALTSISPSVLLRPSPSVPIRGKPSTYSRPKEPPIEPGTLGLGNMGNTCFMNSALQCLAHTRELTEYFLTGVFEDELNFDNPLGMQGAIAKAFGALLSKIWNPTGSNTSYSPREFKQALQRFAPQFSGYQQHDSQELVAFLLDGLHEDLNRVLKKPYVEKPDWEGGGDKELVELATESWEGYMKRNDSVIVDLFQGQYQSTLVCPECSKVSITFDPFMYLTLPLPIQKKWHHDVYYVPWDLNKPHVKVPVEINRDASFRDLRQLLGRWMNANPDNLLTLEVFGYRFYKNLDDLCLCGDMSDGDIIVCFELPCHAQQSRTYKQLAEDPFIVPVFLSEIQPPRHSYGRNTNLFGYPFIAIIDRQQATSTEAMYEAVVDRLQRWTANARDLFAWEAATTSTVQIPLSNNPPLDTLTEIKENGDVITVEQVAVEEGDITDQKNLVVQDDDEGMIDDAPRRVGIKKDLFRLRVHSGDANYGIGYTTYGSTTHRFEEWDQREASAREDVDAQDPPVLLREGDAFFCEFDENVKAYFFGDERNSWEHARWNTWDEYVHPELAVSRKTTAAKKAKGITLQDCLDEFTREEKLGEDDLWYCPRCKKHQQATKRFDLWKVPDMLVVHLKRFSNSRTLRDKIDTLVDFPIEGLDLSDMVGERQVAKRLSEQGVDLQSLGLSDIDEPLIYDLYAVDEHLGGLGGGHYRAYAQNHLNDKWYHFDDSYVTPSRPEAAVNANAYLLFYKRRTSRPLGGKSHVKIEAAKANLSSGSEVVEEDPAVQLPTPPDDDELNAERGFLMSSMGSKLDNSYLTAGASGSSRYRSEGWPTPQSDAPSSPVSSPLPSDEVDPPSFEEAQFDEVVVSSLDPISLSAHQFDFTDPVSTSSPTSSNEAEPDLEQDQDDPWQPDTTRLSGITSRWIHAESPLDSDEEGNFGHKQVHSRARGDSLSDIDL